MAVGRISGPLLKDNLLRNGVNLAFETDLLYLDVINGRVGIKTTAPTNELSVNGTTRTTNLEVQTQAQFGVSTSDVFTISGNTISSTNNTINLVPSGINPVVYQSKISVNSDLQITTNTISTTVPGSDLTFNTAGTGKLIVNSDVLINGDLHVTGDITADGTINVGDQTTDNVVFNAEVNSNFVPDDNNFWKLGTDPNAGGKEWANAYVHNIFGTSITTTDLTVAGIDLALPQGNILYVATTGSDANTGVHQNDPYLTVKYALSQATSGDTVYVYPGTYTEIFPLTIPVGVTLKGSGIRSVIIQPTVGTVDKDAVLLNGETTIEDLTISGFRFNSIDNTGYGFRFATNFEVTSRSPYVRNLTVITRGSTTSPTDPYGFDAGDAGKGAYIDGTYALATSKEAAMLFHSVTFFTPNQECIVATDGVRIEWLNSFSYFADKAIYAYSGTSGFANAGLTRLRINNKTGVWSVGDVVRYYDTDGVTILASGTIDSISGNFINLTGKQLGFETITDRAGKTVYVNGDAKLSTVVKKFGTASLALDGTGDYVNLASTPDFKFGTDDFTIEFWVYRNDAGRTEGFLDFKTANPQVTPNIYAVGTNLYYFTNGSVRITGTAALPSANTWYHIAVSRVSGNTKLFVDGTQVGTTYIDANDYIATQLVIGNNYVYTAGLSGYLDDLRITKGVGRYSSNFPPSTVALTGDLATVLLLHFNGNNNSTIILDDGLTLQDIRNITSGGTALAIDFADYSDFGAEIRAIGSACVYGNYGVYGDGVGVIAYLISENFAYVGAGKLTTNDPDDRIAANEVVELNGAKIYYTSVDNEGNFKVGDNFFVNQKTGEILFDNQAISITTQDGVVFSDGVLTTTILPGEITTGNIKIYDNNIDSTTGPINLLAFDGNINLQSNVNITGDLDVTGSVTIGGNITIGDQNTDSINFVAAISSDLIPATDATYNFGQLSPTQLRWNNVYLVSANINGLVIENNQISTSANNDNLTLDANGTGIISVPNNDVQVDQSLTVGQDLTVTTGLTSLQDVNITGVLTQNGDYNQTGNFTTTGDLSVDGNLTGSSNLVLPQVTISANTISSTVTDTDLILQANGTGIIHVTLTDVTIDQNLSVGGTLEVTGDSTFGNVTVNGTITHTGDYNQTGNFVTTGTIDAGSITSSGTLTLPGITITNNTIESVTPNADLTITANGTGVVSIPTNSVSIDQNLEVGTSLDVTGLSTLNAVTVNGDITQTGAFDQTGNFTTTGDLTVTGNVTLAGPITVPNITISGSSITTNVNNLDLVLTAQGAGKVVIQELGINGTVITAEAPNSDITITPEGTGGVIINSQISMVIPVGATADRPLVGADGMIRYNNQLDRYEGYANGSWIALAGIESSSGATKITPELTPGAGDNIIRFYANNVLVASIDDTKLYAISIQTDQLDISNNTISAVATDTDINFTTTGTGGVVVGDLKFKDGEITNTVSGGITQFTEVGTGYVKIAGTYGTVLPAGNNASRPSAVNSEVGMTRYNTELQYVEVWNGTVWQNVAAQSGGINLVDATSLSIVNAIVFG